MTRPISEILGDARGELHERESKLQSVIDQAKAELADVQRALRKLGSAPARKVRGGGFGEWLRER